MGDEQVQDQQTQAPAGPDVDEEITAEGAAFVHGDPLEDSTGPPNSDSKVEILNEHVKKQLIKEGHGEKPTKYSTCFCKYMGDDFMFQLFGKYRDMALAVKNPCHLNIAACLIKLKRYEEAIGQCSTVLAEEETNVKALFRRGKAKSELGQTDAAREDFLKASKYAPEDKAIVKELRLLAEDDKAVYQKQKEMYKGIYGPRPESKKEINQKKNWFAVIWLWILSLFRRCFKLEKQRVD